MLVNFSGDIGQILPNGSIKIIDRKKNLIKLSQGEYVALEYLENVYGISSVIDDIWVYGNSFKSKLVAVVVPEENSTKKWADLNGHTGSFSDLCSLDQLKNYILEELKLTAERNKVTNISGIKSCYASCITRNSYHLFSSTCCVCAYAGTI